MATCFQNAQYEISCYAYLFIINEMVHKIPLPTPPHVPELTFSRSVEGCHPQTVEVRKRSIVHWPPEEKLWRSRGKGKAFQLYRFALNCALAATKTGRLKKAMV